MLQPSIRLRLPPGPVLGRVGWSAALLLLTFLGWPGRVPGQPLPEDPVEPFREALKLEQNRSVSDDDARKLVLNFRSKNLKAAAARIRTASDLSRALLLVEWRSYSDRLE